MKKFILLLIFTLITTNAYAGQKRPPVKFYPLGNEQLTREQLYNEIQDKRSNLNNGMAIAWTATGVATIGVALNNFVTFDSAIQTYTSTVPLAISGGLLGIIYAYSYGLLGNRGALYDHIDLSYEMAARYNGNPFLQKNQAKNTSATYYSGVEFKNKFEDQVIANFAWNAGLLFLLPGQEGNGFWDNSQLGSYRNAIGIGMLSLGAIFTIKSFFQSRLSNHNQKFFKEKWKAGTSFLLESGSNEDEDRLQAKARYRF